MVKLPSLVRNHNLLNNSLFMSAFDQCKSLLELKQIHALIISFGLFQDESLSSRILSLTAISNFSDIDYSNQIFQHLSNPTLFNWNTIIRGYSKSKNPNCSISVFNEMSRVGVSPDHLTYPFLAKACARLSSIRLGLSLHSCIFKTGFELDRFVRNSLIHMYSTCGDIVSARILFDDMPHRNLVSWNSIIDGYCKCADLVSARELFEVMGERDVVSWSSLIDGYVKGGDYKEALEVFRRMQNEGPKANEVTMVSVLCACAHLGALEKGKVMDKYVKDNGLPMTLVLRTSLVDMYAKCGAIEEALMVFRGVSIDRRDVLIWNAMIGGLASHGLVKESLEMFSEMQTLGRTTPDEITYLCLLSACAHGGLVKEAWGFFETLSKQGMKPMLEHYACMIDVLGRAGHLDEAYEFLNKMPVEPTASMLGALLSGCWKHRRLDLGEVIGKKLVELEPDHDGRYVGLSNVYAVGRRWKEARTMREEMEKKGVKKSPGCSSVEVDGVRYKFIAHDKTHPQMIQIYSVLNDIAEKMKVDTNHLQREEHILFI